VNASGVEPSHSSSGGLNPPYSLLRLDAENSDTNEFTTTNIT